MRNPTLAATDGGLGEPVPVLRLCGPLDAESAAEVEERGAKLIEAVEADTGIVVDLTAVELLTAAGARAVTGLLNGLTARELRAVLVCPPGHPARIALDFTLAPSAWPVHDSVDGAVAALRASLTAHEGFGTFFVPLTKALLRAATVDEALNRVVAATVAAVAPADVASITLRDADGSLRTAAASDDAATELDELQYALGEGPCHDVAMAGSPEFVECADLGAGCAWPHWSPEAVRRGWHGALASALVAPAEAPDPAGALNVFSHVPGDLVDADPGIVRLLANHASFAIAEADVLRRSALEQAGLHAALDSRDVIGQAKGIIMARRRCGAAEALDLLHKMSRNLNVGLAALATTLVARRGDLGPADGEPDR